MPKSKVNEPAATSRQRAGASTPLVFISYRRSENLLHATLLEKSLSEPLLPGAVFRDQTAIIPGDVFPTRIENAIRGAAVVLVLIGQELGRPTRRGIR